MNNLGRVTHIMNNCKILDTIVLKGKKKGSLSIISSLVEYEGNKKEPLALAELLMRIADFGHH